MGDTQLTIEQYEVLVKRMKILSQSQTAFLKVSLLPPLDDYLLGITCVMYFPSSPLTFSHWLRFFLSLHEGSFAIQSGGSCFIGEQVYCCIV